ncbi:EF-hand domain-containing protein [Streptomyces sp. NPDC050610]|uniref:EF-hand domain-containing protein n=1 Tax=Streptomyces sp. NPDC050610 TaxID=3157097 RepID=UPI00343C69E8
MSSEHVESQRSRASKAFDLIDVDGNGEVGIEEIESLTQQLTSRFGLTADSKQHDQFRQASVDLWRDLQHQLDQSGDQKISRKEYVDFYADADPAVIRRAMEPFAGLLFNLFDADGDGKVSRSEFERYHRAWGVPTDQIEGTFEKLDTDRSGDLSKEELHQYLAGFIFGDSGSKG